MSVSKRKHKTLSLQTKMDIINELNSGVKVNDLASLHGVGRATIYDIKKNREKISHYVGSMVSGPGKRHTLKFGDFPMVDSALYEWFLQERSRKAPMSGDILREKAKEIHRTLTEKDDFRASEGWLDKFKKRFGIRLSLVSKTEPSCSKESDRNQKVSTLNAQDKRSSPILVNTDIDCSTQIYNSISIKEEYIDETDGESNSYIITSNNEKQLKNRHIKREDSLDETPLAINSVTPVDQDCAPPIEPFIQMVYSLGNSTMSSDGDEYNIDDSTCRKRMTSHTSASSSITEEFIDDERHKTIKRNRSAQRPELCNEFTIFGQYVASHLQLLPLRSSLKLQCEIQQLLIKARLEHENEHKE